MLSQQLQQNQVRMGRQKEVGDMDAHQPYLPTLLFIPRSLPSLIPAAQIIFYIISLCFHFPALFIFPHAMFCYCGAEIAYEAHRYVSFGP